MEQSILKSTKKNLGVGEEDTSFDHEIIVAINSSFSTLNQVGIGPADFTIEDDEIEWEDFHEAGNILNQVKTFVFLFTRMMFDPPQTSYLIGAFERQLQEHLVRLNMAWEATGWTDPDPPVVAA